MNANESILSAVAVEEKEILIALKIALAWMGYQATKANEVSYVKSRERVLEVIGKLELAQIMGPAPTKKS